MADQPVRMSYLNTPIMSNVEFSPPDEEYLIPGYRFSSFDVIELNDVMVEVSFDKMIETTQLTRPQGWPNADPSINSDRRVVSFEGTVKEYITFGDYRISLRGKMVAEDDEAPLEHVERLRRYLEYPGPFRISGKFINLFDFSQVIVKSGRIVETNFLNIYNFVVELLSDEYVNVKYESVQNGTLTT